MMFRSLVLVATTMVEVFLAGEALSQERPPDAIYEQSVGAVVVIEATTGGEMGLGTGFFVTGAGCIATNYHVVAEAERIVIRRYDGREYSDPKLVDYSDALDVAFLHVEDDQSYYLRLADSKRVRVGEAVFAIGHSLGFLENTYTNGIVSQRRRVEGTQVLQITAPLSRGNSGGPLLDSEGRVIGITSFKMNGGENLNFAVPAQYFEGMIGDVPIGPAVQLLSEEFDQGLVEAEHQNVSGTWFVQQVSLRTDCARESNSAEPFLLVVTQVDHEVIANAFVGESMFTYTGTVGSGGDFSLKGLQHENNLEFGYSGTMDCRVSGTWTGTSLKAREECALHGSGGGNRFECTESFRWLGKRNE